MAKLVQVWFVPVCIETWYVRTYCGTIMLEEGGGRRKKKGRKKKKRKEDGGDAQ